jgi:hypothetical protein
VFFVLFEGGKRKKNSIDVVIMVGLGTEVRKRLARGRMEGSGVHGLLSYHHRPISQAGQGETRLLASQHVRT